MKKGKRLEIKKENIGKMKFPEKKIEVKKQEEKKVETKKSEEKKVEKQKEKESLDDLIIDGENLENIETVKNLSDNLSFNPEGLILGSGQKLEEVEAPAAFSDGREKKDEGKEEGRRIFNYNLQTTGDYNNLNNNNYSASSFGAPLMNHEAQQERNNRRGGGMGVVHAPGFEQKDSENKPYEPGRIQEQQGTMPWQSGHGGENAGREIKYKIRG